MLTISGLRLVKNNYSVQSVSNNNSERIHLENKVDSFSFRGAAAATRKATTGLDEITAQVMARYSDILGDNFKQGFLKPLKDFADKHEIIVACQDEDRLVEIPTDKNLRFSGQVKGVGVWLLSGGQQIHTKPVEGLTKNEAYVMTADDLLHRRIEFYKESNGWKLPIRNAEVPQELKAKTLRIKSALTELTEKWYQTEYKSSQDKVKALQAAYKKLMPEIDQKEFYEL